LHHLVVLVSIMAQQEGDGSVWATSVSITGPAEVVDSDGSYRVLWCK
jgi:hypothetical protein